MSNERVASSLKESLRYLDKMARPNAKDIRDALQRPDSFGHSGNLTATVSGDELFRTWALGPVVEHRDSDTLAKANWQALERYLESRPELADDWTTYHCGHWAVGWVDHVCFRVLDADGSPSEIFRILMAWQEMLSEYPIADEDLHSELECEEISENWDSWQCRELRQNLLKEFTARNAADPEPGDMTEDELESWLDSITDDNLFSLASHHNRETCYEGGSASMRIREREVSEIADALVEGK